LSKFCLNFTTKASFKLLVTNNLK